MWLSFLSAEARPYWEIFDGIAQRIVGGWSLSGTTTWEGGVPFSPVLFQLFCRPRHTGPCRPNIVGPVHITGSRDGYFTTTGGVPLQPDGIPGNDIGPWQRPAFRDLRKTLPETHFAGPASSRQMSLSQRISHCMRLSPCNSAPTSSTSSIGSI